MIKTTVTKPGIFMALHRDSSLNNSKGGYRVMMRGGINRTNIDYQL